MSCKPAIVQRLHGCIEIPLDLRNDKRRTNPRKPLHGTEAKIDNQSDGKFSKFARIHLDDILGVGFARGSIASEATKNAKLRKKRAEAKKSRIDRWPIF